MLTIRAAIVVCLLAGVFTAAQEKKPSARPGVPKRHDTITVSAGLEAGEIEKEREAENALSQARSLLAQEGCEAALPAFDAVVILAQKLEGRRYSYTSQAMREIKQCYWNLQKFEELDRTLEAEAQFVLGQAGPYESSLGHSHLERGMLWLRRNDPARAEKHIREAILTYERGIGRFRESDTYDPEDFANLLRDSKSRGLAYLAVAKARQDHIGDAKTLIEEAYQLAVDYGARKETQSLIVDIGSVLDTRYGGAESSERWRKRSLHLASQPAEPQPVLPTLPTPRPQPAPTGPPAKKAPSKSAPPKMAGSQVVVSAGFEAEALAKEKQFRAIRDRARDTAASQGCEAALADFAEAVRLGEELRNTSVGFHSVHDELARCYERLGRFAEAAATYHRGLELFLERAYDQRIAETHLRLAELRIKQGDGKQAQVHALEALKRIEEPRTQLRKSNPASAEALERTFARRTVAPLHVLGQALALQGDSQGAMTNFEEAYALADRFGLGRMILRAITESASALLEKEGRVEDAANWRTRLNALP